VKFHTLCKLSICGLLAVAMVPASQLKAQHMTLEGYTGGFITPTAYVVYSDKGQFFSHPAVGYHFLNADKVIGDIHTFGIAEGFANRGEVAYARSVHVEGDSALFSNLWHHAGLNVISGKAVAIRDGQGSRFTPGLAVGGVVRTSDRFVTGTLDAQSHTNGDVYVVATKTWLKPPVPLFLNLGWKATNAAILGIGGESTRFGGRLFGGLGIPLPGPWKTAIVPSAGFSQEPPQVKNLGSILVGGKAHIPTTMDYALRITQAKKPHFSFDIGIGQVASNIGTTYIANPPLGFVPVNLQARHVLGMGLSYRY
jgi:hypothetical protein